MPDLDINLFSNNYVKYFNYTHYLDMAYISMKDANQDSHNLPNSIGLSTLLHETDDLPVIEVSPKLKPHPQY